MDTLRTIRLGIQSQTITSKNLREGFGNKIRRTLWSLYYMGKGVRIGIVGMGREQLFSRVIHEGAIRYVSNWAGTQYPTLCGDGFYRQNVPRSEIKNVVDLNELLHRFNAQLSSYILNWYTIDVNAKLYP